MRNYLNYLRSFKYALVCGAMGVLLMGGLALLLSIFVPRATSSLQNWSGLILLAVATCGSAACGIAGIVIGAARPGAFALKWTMLIVIVSHGIAAVACIVCWQAFDFAKLHFVCALINSLLSWRLWSLSWKQTELIIWTLLPCTFMIFIPTAQYDARRIDVEVFAAILRLGGLALAFWEETQGRPARSILSRLLAVGGLLLSAGFYVTQYDETLRKILPDAATIAWIAVTTAVNAAFNARRPRPKDQALV